MYLCMRPRYSLYRLSTYDYLETHFFTILSLVIGLFRFSQFSSYQGYDRIDEDNQCIKLKV